MVVTPWEVKGDIDYDKLIKQFGVSRMTTEIEDKIAEHAGFKHLQLRRGVYLSHRDTDWWIKEYEKGNKVGLYTGRGPSGHVHLDTFCHGSSVNTCRTPSTRTSTSR